MLAAVIRSASPSSRDKGDSHYCFRSLDSMKLRSGPIVWALFVCRLVLGVFWQAVCSGSRSKFPVVIAKVFAQNFMVLYLLCYCFRPIVWALFFCRTIPGVICVVSCTNSRSKFPVVLNMSFLLARSLSCTKSMFKFPVAIKRNFQLSSRFAIRTGEMNYNRLKGSQPKLLGFKFLIAATSLPNLVRLNKYRVNFSKFER